MLKQLKTSLNNSLIPSFPFLDLTIQVIIVNAGDGGGGHKS